MLFRSRAIDALKRATKQLNVLVKYMEMADVPFALRMGRSPATHAPVENGEAWQTAELIPVKPIYTEKDLEGLEHLDYVSGLPPFLRGPYSAMYPMRPWTIRQYAGFSTAAESNAFYRRNLASGQKGLSVAFDLPTHRGYEDRKSVV